ncbi:alpha/beta hydrolase [Aliiroseovarius crassostreae]|uniref:alpha/beta hydrolase n=2 Tax=Aliiroseovarius crassostreae TaxID=154981 RepID=UPI0021FA828B|nr:alpha/beta hydrolase [Aliiroseovarius crassostreae]UWP89044.1 alpha/beta hydrolase [Aliiroseovarius crassostreae]UWP92203.1 alpha/beta hydrolase [Aliiroseovarius crassostreae]UWP98510.1 alpha/beta hydrolase [Aliiroseovarius crassostreae]UWQ07936.1 alpha/beta hydrolase [Aliiroseovarius crassostreae]UWQ11042.1 alpha/beta hydrolase [Aliiroseovarius crassostreae]
MRDLNMSECDVDEVHTLRLDGAIVRYFHRPGETGQTPLLVCNGLGQSLEVLLPILNELGSRPLIAIDMPGVGRSEMRDDIATIPDYAQFTFSVLDKLGIRQFDVLGISWGGALAQQMTHDAPDRIGHLALAITSAGGIGSWWGTPIALSEIMFPLRFTNKTYGNFIGPWMYGGEAILHPEIFREYSKHAIAPSPEGYFTQVRAMCSWTSLPWLRAINTPTLIIAGKYDGLIPIANQLLLASMIPDATLQIYSAGHLLMFTKRHEVGPLISTFLDD